MLAEVHRGLNMRRVRAVSLESELDRYLERIRFSSNLHEKQQREIASLKEDCSVQIQRAQAALRRKNETQERLQRGHQECTELSRKAKTEQLRATMLREAFEQEQTRVGVSLGRAEAFVSDLVAATEGTRRVEVEEQSLARECISALNEIHMAQARDELAAEAKVTQLRRELEAAKDALVGTQQAANGKTEDNTLAANATAKYAKVESECHSVTMELGELQRRCQGVAAIIRRRAADVNVFQRELEELRAKSDKVAKDLLVTLGKEDSVERQRLLCGRLAMLQPRLRLEEAAEAALEAAENRLTSELMDAQGCMETNVSKTCRSCTTSSDMAKQCARTFLAELEQARTELSATSMPRSESNLRFQAPLPGAGPDLEAAGLQRRLGAALAAERANYCRLQEQQLWQRLTYEVGMASSVEGSTAARAVASRLEVKALQHAESLQRCSVVLKQTEEKLEALLLQQATTSSTSAHVEVDAAEEALETRIATLYSELSSLHTSADSKDGLARQPWTSGHHDQTCDSDSGELAHLQQQLKVLHDELDIKDAEIARLDWLNSLGKEGQSMQVAIA